MKPRKLVQAPGVLRTAPGPRIGGRAGRAIVSRDRGRARGLVAAGDGTGPDRVRVAG